MEKKPGAQAKQTTSYSSRELSDDDEAEGENEATGNTDSVDVKRVRRYNSVFCRLFQYFHPTPQHGEEETAHPLQSEIQLLHMARSPSG